MWCATWSGWPQRGTKIHYLTGNHDELLRKFAGLRLGSFRLDNKLVLDLSHGRTWLFHGDVFDVTMQHARWLARLGGHGYDALILLQPRQRRRHPRPRPDRGGLEGR